jgi:hypothetical protein
MALPVHAPIPSWSLIGEQNSRKSTLGGNVVVGVAIFTVLLFVFD